MPRRLLLLPRLDAPLLAGLGNFMTHTPPLSRQQKFFNIWARAVQRTTLGIVKHYGLLRQMADLEAVVLRKRPANMLLKPMPLTHDGNSVNATACYIKHQPMNGTLLYLHGGGFVMGSLAMYQHLVAGLGHAADMRGVYLDYRRAPEHPFPAALDDALTAYEALLAAGDSGPIAIAGDSAGGNLTLALLLKIKERGLPMPFAAAAISPLTNLAFDNDSFQTNLGSELLIHPDWGLRSTKAYVGGHDSTDPLISPIHGDFRGCPPVALHYDTTEVLADDGRTMVDHLESQGVEVTTEVATGRVHVWHLCVGSAPEADASVAALGAFFRKHRPTV